jgi:hypothetical protein
MFTGKNYSPTNVLQFRLTLVSLVLSIKFNEDIYFENSHYAEFGGISTKELAYLEKKFLQYIGYKMMVNPEKFKRNYYQIVNKFKEQRAESPSSSINSLATHHTESLSPLIDTSYTDPQLSQSSSFSCIDLTNTRAAVEIAQEEIGISN